MHAEFLTQAPTPATPGVTCVIDTGVNSNPDNDASVIDRQTVYPGDGSDGDPDAHHGTYLAMNIAAPANGWGMIGIAPQTRILSIRAIDNGAHNFLSSAYQQGARPLPTGQGQRGVNVTTALLALGHADTDTTTDGQAVQNKIDSASRPRDLGGGGGGQRRGSGAVARSLRPSVRGGCQRRQRRLLRLRIARRGARPLRAWLWR